MTALDLVIITALYLGVIGLGWVLFRALMVLAEHRVKKIHSKENRRG
ncbi:hypothetical protein [Thermomonospora cellulosilytica]|uniref:Uncharacterized protein n=1 Tax=Thermomonospora cellulosilytica TaxID=1411118 RepID=A0A7W3MUC6_9ACTN|nr:hypothetical protein [Thermomonospora cellulosilytica]MBA9002029.1 hypothetical protein [Thermomonospora cellulosilytica]